MPQEKGRPVLLQWLWYGMVELLKTFILLMKVSEFLLLNWSPQTGTTLWNSEQLGKKIFIQWQFQMFKSFQALCFFISIQPLEIWTGQASMVVVWFPFLILLELSRVSAQIQCHKVWELWWATTILLQFLINSYNCSIKIAYWLMEANFPENSQLGSTVLITLETATMDYF